CPDLMILFLTHPPTTEFYPLSLHDALPISFEIFPDRQREACVHHRIHHVDEGDRGMHGAEQVGPQIDDRAHQQAARASAFDDERSEEHTSELQSQSNLVCRLLLEKKKI